MQKKSLFSVRTSLKVDPNFTISAKDFPQAAKKAEKLLKEVDPEAQILEMKLERSVLIEDLPNE